MKSPIQASAFAMVDGRIELINATLVQPDFGHFTPKGPRAPIVLSWRNLDDSFISSLGERFMLKDLRLAGPADPGGVVLTGADGQALGRLVWTPDTPGLEILEKGLPLVLVFLALMGLVARGLYGHARNGANELVASEGRASHMALHDLATGLPNERLFADRLNQAMAQARRAQRPMSVLLIDLDPILEGYERAHAGAGDEWIVELAARLKETCRGADTFARLGPTRLAVIQPDGSAASGSALAERLLTAVKAPLRSAAGGLQVSACIGIAVAVGGQTDAAEILRQAQVALARARELDGGQACFFEPEMDGALRLRKSLESDLRQALIDDALTVHYQPQVDRTGKIVGLEALARWDHPDRGLISPAIFIQVAEESGLIGVLGLFMVKRVLEHSLRWRHLRISINMSARQLKLPGLVDDIRALLAKFEVVGQRFEIEIHEEILAEDDGQVDAVLRRLGELGLTVALDNFGAGLSRLSHLARYPIDRLKIDRSFVAALGVDREADDIVSALVKLGRALELDVIAEGVETLEQRDRLFAAGCDMVQGFLLSRPLSADAMEALIRTWVPGRVMAG
jgi:diguanylate cyclase (GGDEF)-like protein